MGGCCLFAIDARAADERGTVAAERIDPLLRGGPGAARPEQVLRAIVRLPDMSSARRDELAARGIVVGTRPDGRVRRLGDLHVVEGTARALAEEAARGTEIRISRALGIHPTDYGTSREVENFDLLFEGPTPTQGPLGRGVTIGTIDTGVNIFHPHFFRADGGAFPWIDVDGNDAFDVGVDAVDITLDGELQPFETFALFDFSVAGAVGGPGFTNGTFDTALDYLYLDFDGDGLRDAGPKEGYDESSPSYGEPLFMPDDANGDGVFAPDERVILLATSQIKAVNLIGQIYTRGENLIELPATVSTDPWAFHGTGTTGIITGGQTHPFRFNRADVPDADVAMVAYAANSPADDAWLVDSMAWLVEDMQATVVNHSWANEYLGIQLDGSNPSDTTLDAASAMGSVQICSAGNRHAVGKHAQFTSSAKQVEFAATLPQTVSGYTPTVLDFDVFWHDPSVALTCTVTKPNGRTHVIEELAGAEFDDTVVSAVRSVSERDWVMLSIQFQAAVSGHVGLGQWTLDCTHDGASELEFHALVDDRISQYEGSRFLEPSPISTVSSPATADHCIGVSGYTVQYLAYPDSVIGQLESYSSFGPRFDGSPGVDIAAPVDAVTPTNAVYGGSYIVFWGTSGSAPQATAAAALMRSVRPDLTPDQILEQLQQSADTTGLGITDGPDPGWGFGKLRAYRALTGNKPPPRPEVEAITLSVEYAYDAQGCAATVHVDGADWDDASYRWDVEYDGTWDSEFEASADRTIVLPDTAEFHVRVDAGARGYIVAGATLVDAPPAECFDAPPAGDTTGADGSDSGPAGGEAGTDGATDGASEGSDGTGAAQDDGGSSGCGCRSDGNARGIPLLFAALALRRRRRR